MAVLYFMGDGFFHIVSYILFAYTYQEYVFILGGSVMLVMVTLLTIGFGFNVVGKEVLTRAVILSPLMAALDFPLKPHLQMVSDWIIKRSVILSFVILWTCNFLALFAPLRKVTEKNIPSQTRNQCQCQRLSDTDEETNTLAKASQR